MTKIQDYSKTQDDSKKYRIIVKHTMTVKNTGL